MKCKHPARWAMSIVDGYEVKCPDDEALYLRCCACLEQLPWGDTNDSDPRVAVERRASLLAIEYAKAGEEDPPHTFSPSERVGWFIHFFDSLGHEDTMQTDNDDLRAGYLARCIATHEEEKEAE